jgi:hypothetical protein
MIYTKEQLAFTLPIVISTIHSLLAMQHIPQVPAIDPDEIDLSTVFQKLIFIVITVKAIKTLYKPILY